VIGRVRVQPRAGGRAANPQALDPFHRRRDALAVAAHRQGIGAELLPQAHRHRVLQVGAARLQDGVKLHRLAFEGIGQAVDYRQ